MSHQIARKCDFRVSHENSVSTNSFRLRLCESQALCATDLPDTTRHPRKSIRNFRKSGHHVSSPTHLRICMLSPFARWLPKFRAWCRITLRGKLYESLGESDLMIDSARSAAETPNFSPKYATKSLEIAIFAHMQNLVLNPTFSYEFSGAPRVFHNLHMIWNSQHTQPQPKRIDATRVMLKNVTQTYK